jgi:hypothetical protein
LTSLVAVLNCLVGDLVGHEAPVPMHPMGDQSSWPMPHANPRSCGRNTSMTNAVYAKTAPRRDVRKVRDPQLIRTCRNEMSVHQIRRSRLCLVRRGGDLRTASDCSRDAHILHQTLHGAPGRRNFFPFELSPYLSNAVDPEVVFPDSLDFLTQVAFPLSAFASPCRISLLGLAFVVCRRCDLNLTTDRLDTVLVSVLVNEID